MPHGVNRVSDECHESSRVKAITLPRTAGPAYRQAGQAAFSVIAANLLVGVAILANSAAQAYYLGASRDIEVYFAAATFSALMIKLSQAGIWSEVLLPVVVHARLTNNLDVAWQVLANVLNLLMVGSLLLVAIMALATAAAIRLLVPGFSAADQQRVVQFFLLLSPTIVLTIATAVMVAVLNSFRQFGRPEMMKAVAQFAAVAVLIVFAPHLGVRAVVLAAGVSAGVYLAGCYGLLWRLGYRQRWILNWREPVLRQILRALRPYLPYTIVSQAMQYAMLSIFSSLPPGSYAVFRYVQTIYDQLNTALLRGIPLVSFTWFAEAAARQDMLQLRRQVRSALHILAFLAAPTTLAIVILSGPLAALLWRRGKFGAQETTLAALLLSIVCIGFFFDGAFLLFRRALLALRRTGLVNAGNLAVQVGLIGLFYVLTGRFGVAGAATANVVVTAFSMALFWVILRRQYGDFAGLWDQSFFSKLALSLLATGLCAYGFRWLVLRLVSSGGAWREGLVTVSTLAVLVMVYAAIAMLMKMREFDRLIDVTASRLRIPPPTMSAPQAEA